jgi:poly(A) polymerase
VLPELDATVDFSQEAGRRHKDVWEHTKQVVLQSVPRPDRALGGAAARHRQGADAGHAARRQGHVSPPRRGGRAHVGADRQAAGLRQAGTAQIRFLILNHLRANAYEPGWTDAAVRRFDHEMGEHLDDLLELSCADVTSRARAGARRRSATSRRCRNASWRSGSWTRACRRCPAGLGNAIMEAFAIPPSKRIGELRKLCEDAIERGELEERREADYYIAYLRGSGAVLRRKIGFDGVRL